MEVPAYCCWWVSSLESRLARSTAGGCLGVATPFREAIAAAGALQSLASRVARAGTAGTVRWGALLACRGPPVPAERGGPGGRRGHPCIFG